MFCGGAGVLWAVLHLTLWCPWWGFSVALAVAWLAEAVIAGLSLVPSVRRILGAVPCSWIVSGAVVVVAATEEVFSEGTLDMSYWYLWALIPAMRFVCLFLGLVYVGGVCLVVVGGCVKSGESTQKDRFFHFSGINWADCSFQLLTCLAYCRKLFSSCICQVDGLTCSRASHFISMKGVCHSSSWERHCFSSKPDCTL